MKSINDTEKVTVCEIWHNGVFIGLSTGFKTEIKEEIRVKLQETINRRLQVSIGSEVYPGVKVDK